MQSLKKVLLCAALLALMKGPASNAHATGMTEDVTKHVAQMTVRVIADRNRAASGFIWPDAGHVVTAFHVVAGDSDQKLLIEYPMPGGKVRTKTARAIKFNQTADLVLLEVENPLPRKPGTILSSPPQKEMLWVIGFPFGTSGMRSRDLTISDIAPRNISGSLESEDDRQSLRSLGFPSIDMDVVQLNGDLLPGDSGAPIVNAEGVVVAVGNGGLRNGTVGIGWAVPTAYLSDLASSDTFGMLSQEKLSLLDSLFIFTSKPFTPKIRHDHQFFRTSFEDINGNTDSLNTFVSAEPIFEPCTPLSSSFTTWRRTEQAHSGRHAVNLIPGGNPKRETVQTNGCTSPTVTVSAAILAREFETKDSEALEISYFELSTSNPRPRNVHNCDSSLNIYVSRDGGAWEHFMAVCGQYKDESVGWQERRFTIPAKDASSMQLAFTYSLQNADGDATPDAVYLIDDVEIRAKSRSE